MGNRVAIVGVGQTHHRARRPDVNMAEMVGEAVRAAIADAQLKVKDIEAVFCGNMETFEGVYLPDHGMADEIGAFMRPGMKLASAGTTGAAVFVEAFNFAASGLFRTALAIGFQKHDAGSAQAALATTVTPIWGRGASSGAIAEFAQQAQTYMRQSGAKEEHAAMIRLKADRGACRNPYAHLKLGLRSVDEVLKSGYLVWPIRLLDFCPQSCGATAAVIAVEEEARRITKKPVWIADVVTVHQEPFRAGSFGDPTGRETYSQDVAAEKLYKRHGITNPRRDIDYAEVYEPSNWEEMMLYEHFHFCEKHKGWELIEKGITEIEGEFPVNASGGVLATNPIGASPMNRIVEAALQIRGDAGAHQVTRDVKTAIASALGGANWTMLTLLKRSL